MQKISPCLWFDKEAEDAAKFYCSVFKHSQILNTTYYPEAGQEITGGVPGSVLTVDFELEGQTYTALNGGPAFKFNEAISLMVECEDQAEVDELWGKLSAVPEAEQCGWVKDKYGLSWQIIPRRLNELMGSPDKAANERVMAAMLKMHKLDIAALEAAARG